MLGPPCNSRQCHVDATCINNLYCQCKEGFVGDGERVCFDCGQCDVNALCRPDMQQCVCREGFEGDGKSCARSGIGTVVREVGLAINLS